MIEKNKMKTIPDENYFFSELLNINVLLNNKKIGKLSDVIIVEMGTIPHITQFIIKRSLGKPSLMIPMSKVVSISKKQVVIDIESMEAYEKEPEPNDMLLRDYVLDKKVIDIEEHEVSIVYDIRIAVINGKAYVWDVDFSSYGLFRRIGLKKIAAFLNIKEDYLPWSYVQALPLHISSFKGDLKLKTLKEKLSEIPPVAMADILEELDNEQRTEIFKELEPEHASDTLEELEPKVQREMLSSLSIDTVAMLINDMTPAQASDLLSVISFSERESILKFIEPALRTKIESILENPEENILNFTTVNFLKFSGDETVISVKEKYHDIAREKDVLMYLYITDENDLLEGVIDIKELLLSEDSVCLKDIMIENVITLNPHDSLRNASSIFIRYGFRAIPVIDENNKILGVIPYRDVMNINHRFLG